jgi:glycosyl hydrolase family 59 (putative galactocerebrosidase)
VSGSLARSIARLGVRLVVGMAAPLAWAGAGLAVEDATTIDFAKSAIGSPPTDFEFQRTGEGDLGQWTLVRDPTAAGGLAIEHISTDQHDDRFPLAVYQPIAAENLEVKVGLKIVSGSSLTAGFAVSLRNPSSYYAISANAFEQRVDLLLFSDGKPSRVDSAEADVMRDRWHTLGVTLNDDHFKVSFDGKVLFTAFERTRRKDGHVALWTQEDNITRFDRIDVRVLLPTEWR